MPSPLLCSNNRLASALSASIRKNQELSALPHIRAVEHIRRMRGGTQAQLMRSQHGGYYIVKFQNNPQGRRILANELLGTQLATRLGLPTTKVGILNVDDWLIEATEDLRIETARTRQPFAAGLQFGSRFPRNPHLVTVFDFLPDRQLKEVENLRDFLGMLVFDQWTCNTDGRQTIFYCKKSGSPYMAEMIDQGWCFNGQEWNFPDSPLRGLYARRIVYEHVGGIDDFGPWLEILEKKIGIETISELAGNIPPEWYESDSASLHRLIEKLDSRRRRVPELLWFAWKHSRDYFPNWHGSFAA